MVVGHQAAAAVPHQDLLRERVPVARRGDQVSLGGPTGATGTGSKFEAKLLRELIEEVPSIPAEQNGSRTSTTSRKPKGEAVEQWSIGGNLGSSQKLAGLDAMPTMEAAAAAEADEEDEE